jgi:protein required for attachment to host cells
MLATGTKPITWILVADGKTAQIYKRTIMERYIPLAAKGKHRHTEEVHALELVPVLAEPLMAEPPTTYQMGRNQTGMVFESSGGARHMSEPNIDARKEVKQHFAQRIADFLNTAKIGKAFGRLVLVAPPAMLGEIEARLNANARSKVSIKLPKDLTHLSGHELAEHLENID